MSLNKEKLGIRTKIVLFLTLATLGLGAACAQAEPTSFPTQTAIPTPVPTATMTAFERNCANIPAATRMVAVASTILGSLYAQKITPGQVDLCIPVVVTVNEDGTNCFFTDDLLEGHIPGKLKDTDETELCYGTSIQDVLKACSTSNP